MSGVAAGTGTFAARGEQLAQRPVVGTPLRRTGNTARIGGVIVASVLAGCTNNTPPAAQISSGSSSPVQVTDSGAAAAGVAASVSAQPETHTDDPGEPPAPQADTPTMRLQPYGAFQWQDTLLEAVSKVRQIEAATDVDLILLFRRMPAGQFDGPGLLQTWIQDRFAETATYRTQFLRSPPALPRPYYDVGAQIEAKSLSLVGVGYSLKVTYTSAPGLIVIDPQRVRRQSQEFFGPDAADDVPLVLSEVELFPAGVVSPEAHRELIDLLLQKYGRLRVKNPSGDALILDYLGVIFRDASDNSLDLYPGGRLLYKSGDVHRQEGSLADRYRDHLRDFEERQRNSRAQQRSRSLNDV